MQIAIPKWLEACLSACGRNMRNTKLKVKYFDRSVGVALALGSCGLVFNMLTHFAGFNWPVGNFFAVIAALALGSQAALIAATLTIIPAAIISGQAPEALREFTVILALGYCASNWRSIPAFALCTIVWLVWAPVEFLILQMNPDQSARSALLDITFSLLAGSLLLNRRLWGWLTFKPRQTTFQDLVLYGTACLLTLGFAAGAGIYTFNLNILGEGWVLSAIASFYACTLVCVTLLAHVGGSRIAANITQYLPRTLTQNTFSGLSSTQWRRGFSDSHKDSDERALVSRCQTSTNNRAAKPVVEGIIALTKNGTICFVNRTFRKLINLADNEVVGKNIDQLSILPEVKAALLSLLSTPSSESKTIEVKLNELPQRLRYLEFSSQNAQESQHSSLDGGPDSIIVSLRDITERRVVEDHLLKGQRLGSLGNVVKGLAHSLNNYLTSIAGHLSYAQQPVTDAQHKAALVEALEATKQAAGLIRNLLEYADGDTRELSYCEFSRFIKNQTSFMHKLLGAELTLETNITDEKIAVACDQHLITQALSNVLINAKEALKTIETGKVKLTLDTEDVGAEVASMITGAKPGRYARIKITDNGHGMTADVLKRAFDPLFSTKTQFGNSGLGLSIVYSIVRAHDGFLSFESSLDRGTAISIYLPCKEYDSSMDPSAKAKAIKPTEGRSALENILVVEDDHQVREVVAHMLSTLGYQVTACENGNSALEACESKEFDLVLVDMMMPKMGGMDLINEIKSRSSKTRTLLMTGYGAGAVDVQADTIVIPKPFDINTLAQVIYQSLHPEVANSAANL